MTTAFNYQRRFIRAGRKNGETSKLSLFSPLTLLVLVGLLFVFFFTASNEPAYLRSITPQQNEVNKEEVKPDPVVMYRQVVTNADAIRSVLQ
jgi:hypothetical protein